LTGLVKNVNGFVHDNKGTAAFVVSLEKETDDAKAKLKKLAKDEKIVIPLTINADKETPKKFQLNDKVKYTVLVYRDKKVTANFALNTLAQKDIDTVLDAAKAALKAKA
jgi:aspartyl/asparaginyl-tRNA synthetase